MEFSVLGPLAVTHADGSVQLAGGLRRRLLAALLVNVRTVVSADRLIDVLWGDHAPRSALRSLHNQVWRVRAALDECAPGSAEALVTQPPGYVLRIDPATVDSWRFEQAITEAVAESGTRPEYAVARLTEALDLWRGLAFAEFAGEEFCRYEAMRLEELRLVAAEERFEASLALGRQAELIGEIEAFAAEHPFRERPRGLLMTALYRSGRQADAVAVYREFHELLAEQLGLRPSAELRERHEHMLRGSPDPAAESRVLGGQPAGNLRLELSELIGRDEDAAAALTTMARARVTTLTGVGGVGKTRFAARLAAAAQARFPHGVWMCELAAVRDGGLVPDVLATTLGVQQPQGLSVTDGLVDFLRSRRTLLVIDNCEHVLDAAAHLVDALASSCPGVCVLATSREPLGVEGEHVLPVRPLPVPPLGAGLDRLAEVPSVGLFVDRARAAVPTFTLGTHNAGAVAAICRGLDGLPLAIELAATRLRTMSADEIAGRLERGLHFLHSTRRVREERHSTLAAVVDWSCALLEPLDRTVFERLSVLVGSFTMDDAVAIASDEEIDQASAGDAVTDLVHKSMLAADTDRVPSRYTMLETLRIYGRERLERGGQLDAARRRHAAYCLAVAEASAAGLVGPDEARWADRISGLLDDLRGAHSWALTTDPAMAVRLSAALLRYTSAHGPSEVYGWADRAAAAVPDGPGPHLAATLAVAAAGAARRGDLTGANELVKRALRAVPGQDDPARRHALWVLARVASFQGRFDEAATLYMTVAQFAERVGDQYSVAYVTASSALQYAYQGRTARAMLLAQRAHRLATATGNPTAIAWSDYALGVALQDRDPDRAVATLEQAREIGRSGGNTYLPGVALSVAAAIMVRHGDPYRAARLTAEVICYWSHESHWAQQWVALRTAVVLLTRARQDEAAATLYGALRSSRAAIPPVGAEAIRLAAAVAELTTRLDAGRFAAATARGATLSDDDAVAFARTSLERMEHVRPVSYPRSLSC
ncbi:BTAD domain-containing putative transcriptional regulator [Actinophytocola sp.]|uniref:BTAD domain-containing putative transcriptional regulator n=1 Tax=Actinophytocola sp. TaxID=1872138 RepID=UPI002ED21F06